MMLSAGENPLWVANQMGHRDTEMIFKVYGKWIPDAKEASGYAPSERWGQVLTSHCVATAG